MDPPHKAGVAQPQNRHQPHQVTGQFINIVKLQRFPSPLIKLRRVITLSSSASSLQAIENALIAIVAGHPAVAERTIASHPMAAGFILTEGQDDMQMMLAPLNIAGRKPEIFANKMIEIELRRQEQRQRIQQAGFTQAFSPISTLFCSSINDKRLMPRKPTISTRSRCICPPLGGDYLLQLSAV
jgi:hypothetical protein